MTIMFLILTDVVVSRSHAERGSEKSVADKATTKSLESVMFQSPVGRLRIPHQFIGGFPLIIARQFIGGFEMIKGLNNSIKTIKRMYFVFVI